MTQRFYFDTSVFGGLYDIKFEKETTLLLEKVSLGQIICVYSNLTESELSNAPQQVKDSFQNLKDEHKEVVSTPKVRQWLADIFSFHQLCFCTQPVSDYRVLHVVF